MGGTIQIKGDDDDNLQIVLHYQSQLGNSCTGDVTGTGKLKSGSEKIIMETSSGCKITLEFTGTLVSVQESADCKSYHGTDCSFDGVYFKQ